ncbi:MipA/OmpV family protein [Fusobacterium polymorphum]|uniref:MipA/OmpV family protein n=1 Tax=Fusobacterium nucleatum subsp. polymorphum TaxID=76857 RepID=UPI00300A59A2
MDSGYRTIKKRKFQQTFGLKADIRLDEISENLTVTPYFSVGNRGAQTGASLSYLYMPAENIIISPSISTKYLSKKYTDYYFGVDRDELGGNITNEYNPDGAFEFGAGLAGIYSFTKHISGMIFVNVSRYSSEVRKSPITKDKTIASVGAGLKYTF